MKVKSKDLLLVSMQFFLFVAYTLPIDSSLVFFPWFKTIGSIIAIVGIVVLFISLLQLNKNLSPFPTPKDNAILIQNGLYAWVRHPIYTGVLLLFFGYGIDQSSFYKLVITLLLGVLFYFKTQYEELQLQKKYPEYTSYKKNKGRFFPKFI